MQLNKKIDLELVFETLVYVFGILAIGLFYKDNYLLTFLLMIAWGMGIVFWHSKYDIYFYTVAAIVGPVGEIFCIYFGAWQYANPTIVGIPMWLPLAWGFIVMLAKRIAETFIKLRAN